MDVTTYLCRFSLKPFLQFILIEIYAIIFKIDGNWR